MKKKLLSFLALSFLVSVALSIGFALAVLAIDAYTAVFG